ncbi:MAG: hypothetical protein P8Q23_11750, partial [Paracoccaceae bacterium]|nr:hypothetical protein [Paracoccaceae bacterium]
MVTFDFRTLIGESGSLSSAMLGLEENGLWVISGVNGAVSTFQLSEGNDATLVGSKLLGDGVANLGLTDAYFDNDDRVWLWDHIQKRALVYHGEDLSAVSLGGNSLGISGIVQLGDAYVVSGPEPSELRLISGEEGTAFDLLNSYQGGTKDSIATVSDLITVKIGQREFVIAASHDDNGLSCFETYGNELILVDSIGAKDGVWITGVNDLEVVEVAGETFVLAASAEANAVVSLRLNAEGVFFPVDQLWDTRETRFGGVSDMASFEWYERDFTILGGTDGGLSLIETLPGGGLFNHTSIAQSVDWLVGQTADLVVEVIGDEAQVFASGTLDVGVAQLNVDLSRTGGKLDGTAGADTLSGGWMDDLIFGQAGDDNLVGRAGDDVLIDGAGSDVLTGENGADVFVFVADGDQDKITDFVQGEDRIHLGGWGQIYAWTALEISETTFGAKIVWGDEILNVYAKN